MPQTHLSSKHHRVEFVGDNGHAIGVCTECTPEHHTTKKGSDKKADAAIRDHLRVKHGIVA